MTHVANSIVALRLSMVNLATGISAQGFCHCLNPQVLKRIAQLRAFDTAFASLERARGLGCAPAAFCLTTGGGAAQHRNPTSFVACRRLWFPFKINFMKNFFSGIKTHMGDT